MTLSIKKKLANKTKACFTDMSELILIEYKQNIHK